MTRELVFHDSAAPGDLERALRRISNASPTEILVVGQEPPNARVQSVLQRLGLPFRHVREIPSGTAEAAPLTVLVGDDDPALVSRALHACIDRDVRVAAPVSADHVSRRTVYFMSIPKAGTHMMLRLFELMGLPRSDERQPVPGTWCTPTGYQYHAPCRELFAGDWFEPLGRQPFLRSPSVFMYRHPLDIVVSELDWFSRPGHAFSNYLASFATDDDRLEALIADPSVMGTIRDRVMRYAGWVRFGNVCAVSYEELVGDRGGGSDAAQRDAIWALQLKLQIPGEPCELAARLYDPGSATFSKGRIGRHTECFRERHSAAVAALPQDFLQTLGYRPGIAQSSFSAGFRCRPLAISQLAGAALFTPRLVRENVRGANIVEIAGRYYPVRQGHPLHSDEDARAYSDSHEGFIGLEDAVGAAMRETGPMPEPSPILEEGALVAPSAASELVVEGCLGFNVVRLGDQWLAIDQSMGPTDLPSLSQAEIASLESQGLVRVARSLPEALGLLLSIRIPRLADLEATLIQQIVDARRNAEQACAALERRLAEMMVRWNALSMALDQVDGRVGHAETSAREVGIAAMVAMQELMARISLDPQDDGVLEHGFFGFDIVHAHGCWFALRHDESSGLDMPARDELSALVETGKAVEGATVIAVKTGVLRLVLDQALVRTDELAQRMLLAFQEIRDHRHGRVE